ncbi:MAG: hypothetical protein RLZZ164_479 [Actinomycetota bacterium]|jgi:uncharacterized protein (DUF1800 family)
MAVNIALENAVLNKLTYGPTKASRAEFRKLGLAAWVADQLNPSKAEFKTTAGILGQFRALNMTQVQIQNSLPYSINSGRVSDELAHTTLYRRFASSRQFYETLVEFLEDYNPIPLFSDPIKRLSYDREVIRKYALGTYPDLLYASAMHPAMLQFLSGYANERNHPNENYGRELLELFTVTTATPYTQDDVVNAARVFSGISWYDPTFETNAAPNRHWQGTVKVLDWTDPNLGRTPNEIFATARSLTDYLALRPDTAVAFATRMAKRYVSDNPSASIVQAMSQAYLASKGSIPETAKAMVFHTDFATSGGKKLKRPVEHLISTMRVLEMNLDGDISAGNVNNFDDYFHGSQLSTVWWFSMKGGHSPFDWPFPNGYPDTEQAWVNLAGQLTRWNIGAELTSGWSGFAETNYKALLGAPKNTVATIVDAAAAKILGYKLVGTTRTKVIAGVTKAIGKTSTDTYQRRLQFAVQLVLALEDWNRR